MLSWCWSCLTFWSRFACLWVGWLESCLLLVCDMIEGEVFSCSDVQRREAIALIEEDCIEDGGDVMIELTSS